MEFTKMHGLGNDFVIINDMPGEVTDYPGLAKNLCRRHFGIGADGLVLLQPSQQADFKMRIFNADGSEAEMCGNAIRCLARYVFERGLVKEKTFTVETKESIKEVKIYLRNRRVHTIRVDMGFPVLSSDKIPVAGPPREVIGEALEVLGEQFYFTAVSMGNPHCVIFVPAVDEIDLDRFGPAIEHHPLFPARVNVEFAEIVSSAEVKVAVWERGVGQTLACGTGACAAVVAGVLSHNLPRCVNVYLPGGCLEIEWEQNGPVYMSGPAEEVFRGEIDL